MRAPSARLAALVAVGGAVGTLARHGVVEGLGTVSSLPAGTLVVNLLGSLLLGVVVAAVASEQWRTALGTGVLGGFTTYSALSEQVRALLVSDPSLGVAYALSTLMAGWLLALVGLALGRRWAAR